MIGLIGGDAAIKADMRGIIRYLAYTGITAPWIPLNGQWVSVAENPIVFSIFLYRFGRQGEGSSLMFRLPNYNGEARFFKTTSTRVGPLTVGEWGQSGHNHPGTCAPAGAHNHESPGRSWMSGGTGKQQLVNGPRAPGYFPKESRATQLESQLNDHEHIHTANDTGPAQIPPENLGTKVEPQGYGVLACIHGG